MGLKRTKLLGVQSITGINTVGILTVGTTQTAGGVGIASTSYVRGVIMHNTGLGTATSSLYVYPNGESNITVGQTAYRLARVDIDSNETFFFEPNYPIVLADGEKIIVEITKPSDTVGGLGVGTIMNYQVLGDTDI
jgi:hypothetical protein|tara:strand:+ start:464 stop:871 length:408 start_codon:yes stop_codon:yes gene_type:complete